MQRIFDWQDICRSRVFDNTQIHEALHVNYLTIDVGDDITGPNSRLLGRASRQYVPNYQPSAFGEINVVYAKATVVLFLVDAHQLVSGNQSRIGIEGLAHHSNAGDQSAGSPERFWVPELHASLGQEGDSIRICFRLLNIGSEDRC